MINPNCQNKNLWDLAAMFLKRARYEAQEARAVVVKDTEDVLKQSNLRVSSLRLRYAAESMLIWLRAEVR